MLYFVWFFLLVLCLLRIWCKRLSTRLFRIAYSREESQINRGKITARSTNGDQYRGTNCHEIAACFGTQFWNRAKHRFRNRTKFMRNLEKRHFLTSWPVPVPDLEGGGGGAKFFFPPFGPQFGPIIRGAFPWIRRWWLCPFQTKERIRLCVG